jgi:hypothetical protein
VIYAVDKVSSNNKAFLFVLALNRTDQVEAPIKRSTHCLITENMGSAGAEAVDKVNAGEIRQCFHTRMR